MSWRGRGVFKAGDQVRHLLHGQGNIAHPRWESLPIQPEIAIFNENAMSVGEVVRIPGHGLALDSCDNSIYLTVLDPLPE